MRASLFAVLLLVQIPSFANIGNWRSGKGGKLFTENDRDLLVKEIRIQLGMKDGCIALNPKPILKEFTWTTRPPNPVREFTTRYRIFLPAQGVAGDCDSVDPAMRNLTDWRARVRYEVVATATNPSLMMGFPIPIDDNGIDPDGVNFKPGIGNFVVSVNGTPLDYEVQYIPDSTVKGHPALTGGGSFAIVFIWAAPIQKGERYTIEVSYDFLSYEMGGDFTREQLASKSCWPNCEGFNGIEYYLSPINTWNQSPPVSLSVEIDTGDLTPAHFSLSRLLHHVAKEDDLELSCIDRSAIHAGLEGRFPKADLNLNYGPQSLADLTPDRWSKWVSSLGQRHPRDDASPLPLTCDFIAHILETAPSETADSIRLTPCLKSCPE